VDAFYLIGEPDTIQYKSIELGLRGLIRLIKLVRLELTYIFLYLCFDPTREHELPPYNYILSRTLHMASFEIYVYQVQDYVYQESCA
jgi:hypothetical protein